MRSFERATGRMWERGVGPSRHLILIAAAVVAIGGCAQTGAALDNVGDWMKQRAAETRKEAPSQDVGAHKADPSAQQGAGSGSEREVITNETVLSLSKAGVSESVIIAKLQNGPTQLDTRSQAIIDLKKAGVGNSVLEAMTNAGSSGVSSGARQEPPAVAKPSTSTNTAERSGDRPIEERIRVGMTRAEVRTALGEPAGRSVDSSGLESWNYNDSAKMFIPFFAISGGKLEAIVVNFDANGRVKNWSSKKQGLY